jgi:hypothetical protein
MKSKKDSHLSSDSVILISPDHCIPRRISAEWLVRLLGWFPSATRTENSSARRMSVRYNPNRKQLSAKDVRAGPLHPAKDVHRVVGATA